MSTSDAAVLSPGRRLTDEEKGMIWKKPSSHKASEEERRICGEIKRNWNRGEMKLTNILLEGDAGSGKTQLAKALSANFGLPYTKVTCFADMDKSDIVGSILPVLSSERLEKLQPEERRLFQALYENAGFSSAVQIVMGELGISREQASGRLKRLLKLAAEQAGGDEVEYRFYPSEIVRAYRNGYLLELQEPTVIRDAAILMALNSALELDGSMNLPTEVISRHPDFIVVITTNRGYNGTRPLNEALRDRVQHTEKMDLPSKEVMIERGIAKTGYADYNAMDILARAVIILDEAARTQAIKGVAGMRSFIYWADAVAGGASAVQSMYHKVIYKMTTNREEIKLLEEALHRHGMMASLDAIQAHGSCKRDDEIIELRTEGSVAEQAENPEADDVYDGLRLRKSADSDEQQRDVTDDSTYSERSETEDNGSPKQLAGVPEDVEKADDAAAQRQEREFRKQLNKEARAIAASSVHHGVKLVVHRPDYEAGDREEYERLSLDLMPVVKELAKRTLPLLEHESSEQFARNRAYGTKFQADHLAFKDYKHFAKRRPPSDSPSLIVGLRVDESHSMSAFDRLYAAKRAAIAVYEFCRLSQVPVLIYGDTADVSKLEQMSIYAYADFGKPADDDKYRLMGIRPRSNNRDGLALRVMAERLAGEPQQTKLLVSISDGQPKALDDYTGSLALEDMKRTIAEYERKGVIFLAAAIGRDKDVIHRIYGDGKFLDIADLRQFPHRLVQIVARYL